MAREVASCFPSIRRMSGVVVIWGENERGKAFYEYIVFVTLHISVPESGQVKIRIEGGFCKCEGNHGGALL